MLRLGFTLLAVLALPGSAVAQSTSSQSPGATPKSSAWTWTTDANVFFGHNYQHRKFTDFSAWESQNWFMLHGDRPLDAGRLSVLGMLSLEPVTMKALGSPQVFQTGETYRGAPLIDYQHPHDLLMGLGTTYRIGRRRTSYVVGADLVGSPALGPPAFMHRESARNNPQTPLAHHHLDATHITTGVVRGGIEVGRVTLEASAFRGEEPNENRLNIDQPRLNSWSLRGGWRGPAWQAQLSGAHLHQPEATDPYDHTRLTASIGYGGLLASRRLDATVAWGQNREIHGVLDGYLAEWNWALTDSDAVYGRGEHVARDILNRGSLHPRGFVHFHQISRVSALTLGYVRELRVSRGGRVGLGGDVTLHRASTDLQEPYGRPESFHIFLRWRPSRQASQPHLH